MDRKLTRSEHRLIGGVCGGIAEYFGWSPPATRVLYVLVSVLSAAFPGILVYILLWIFLPPPPPGFRLEDYRVQ
ncbi:PspC domain-containing protein [Luteimonas viscosa]|uniref:PspC domain-containing protein n=1 Tax=Luteimonas viscosa TaxID=1132694 RepID=A0A5D4XQW8_9GAMM|nr:PspC domain-containing protein [Luteimonas viscosa]TYT26355.1 PspC domain-containing protein [Luteimonas viscosa]